MKPIPRWATAGAAPLVVAFALAGCGSQAGSPVPVDESDSTPPIVSRLVAVDLQDVRVTSTSGPMRSHWGGRDSVLVAMHVDDPEGVKEAALWGTTETTCVDASGLATKTGPGLATQPLVTNSDPAKAGDMTRNARETNYTINASAFSCPSGSTQLIVEQVFWGTGRNFGGGIAKSETLTLVYVRPWRPEKRLPIAGDPFSGDGAEHATVVESDTFSHGSTVVAVFQAGRFPSGGGASGIGYARSGDAGQTWVQGFLPGMTTASGGVANRVTDPSIAYDKRHGVWLASIAQLRAPFGFYPEGPSNYAVARSTDDGISWSAPVVSVPEPPGRSDWAHDQGWIACDNWPQSPYYGRCYVVVLIVPGPTYFSVVHSDDGGATWSNPIRADSGGSPKIVVQPDGAVVVLTTGPQAIRSTDGGESFGSPVTIAPRGAGTLRVFFASDIVTLDKATSDGAIFAAWHDGTDILLTSSPDGVTWAPPRVIVAGTVQRALPALAVDETSSGSQTRLAIQYYSMPHSQCDESCELDVSFVASTDAGATWSEPTLLDGMTSKVGWHAYRQFGTTRVYFVGDYVSASFADSRFIAVFPLAVQAPDGDLLTQPLWGAALEVP